MLKQTLSFSSTPPTASKARDKKTLFSFLFTVDPKAYKRGRKLRKSPPSHEKDLLVSSKPCRSLSLLQSISLVFLNLSFSPKPFKKINLLRFPKFPFSFRVAVYLCDSKRDPRRSVIARFKDYL